MKSAALASALCISLALFAYWRIGGGRGQSDLPRPPTPQGNGAPAEIVRVPPVPEAMEQPAEPELTKEQPPVGGAISALELKYASHSVSELKAAFLEVSKSAMTRHEEIADTLFAAGLYEEQAYAYGQTPKSRVYGEGERPKFYTRTTRTESLDDHFVVKIAEAPPGFDPELDRLKEEASWLMERVYVTVVDPVSGPKPVLRGD